MRKKITFFFFFILLNMILLPVIADSNYGIKDNSEYIWDVTQEIGGESIQYRLTARFNLRQNMANITKYFYSNGSVIHSNMFMNQIKKFIIASHERHGQHNYFYTGIGSLKFPRHVLIIEDNESTQIIDYKTGITLFYNSDLQVHELISGDISITWIVWLILGITINLSILSIIFIYNKSKKQYPVLVYGNTHSA